MESALAPSKFDPKPSEVEEQLDQARALLESAPSLAAHIANNVRHTAVLEPHLEARCALIVGQAAARQTHLSEAIAPLSEACQVYTRLGLPLAQLEAHLELGKVYQKLGDFSGARQHLDESIALAERLGKNELKVEALNFQAAILNIQGEHALSLDSLDKALSLVRELDLPEHEANILNNIGIIHTMLGDYPRALEHLMEVYRLTKTKLPGTRSEAFNLGSIGNLYMEMKEYTKALDFYGKTLEVARRLGNKTIEVAALNNQATAYQRMGEWDPAKHLFQQALELAQQARLKELAVNSLDGLGQIHHALGHFRVAVDCHGEALSISRQIQYRDGEIFALLNLGRDFLANQDPEKAIQPLKAALELASQTQRIKAVIEAHELLAQAYEQLGHPTQALLHYRQFHLAERELFSQENQQHTRKLATQFELERFRSEAETYRLRTEMAQQAQLAAEAKVLQRTRELEASQRDILQRLALAAEYRDDDTGEHTLRVGTSAGLIAQRLGLPKQEVELIAFAARLHDVGKIGIPDAILLKPGRFTPEEFDLMKSHTLIGARMLSGGNSKLLHLAEEIALSHHERWNGKGYPKGLAGEQIPLAGRIVAVADVFDALTHVRPYKPAWNKEQALEELRVNAGSQFDPQIVEVALEVFGSPDFVIQPSPLMTDSEADA